jgi:hypothetical protein
MKVGTGRTQLYSAMKTCTAHWEQTRRSWRDEVAGEFEANCLIPLQVDVQAVLHAIDRLSVVLGDMEHDCE